MSMIKDNEKKIEQNPSRSPEVRSKEAELPTSILGPGGDLDPPSSTTGGSSGNSSGGPEGDPE
jgi:hypothetical protein